MAISKLHLIFVIWICISFWFYPSILGIIGNILIVFFIRFALLKIPTDCDLLLLFYIYFGKHISDLGGKVIWITGASTGIGEALVYHLSKAKVKLIISARSEDKLNKVKARCTESGLITTDDILLLPFDMTDYSKHEWAFNSVMEKFGKLDILISNAGRSQRGRWEKITTAVDEAMFNLNVFSLVSLSRIVTRHFMSVGKGHHVVVSSTAGKVGVPMSASYDGSKFALMGYFECLRAEQGSKGISITMLCPGPTESNLMAGCLGEDINDFRKGGMGVNSATFVVMRGHCSGQMLLNVHAVDVMLDRETMGPPSQRNKERMMSAERCAELSVIATVNKLNEVWMAPCPVLLLMYVAQYLPNVFKWFLNNFDFAAISKKLRDGK